MFGETLHSASGVKQIWPLLEPLPVSEAVFHPHVRCFDGVWRQHRDSYHRNASETEPFVPLILALDVGDILLKTNDGGSCCARRMMPSQHAPDLKSLFVLPEPESVCHLLLNRAWSNLVVLGRWGAFTSLLPERVQEQIGHIGADPPCHSDAQLTAPACMALVTHIRRWAPSVLTLTEDVEGERVHLEASIRWLQGIACGLPMPGVDDADATLFQRNRQAYSSLFMIKMLLLTRLIPGSVDVKKVLLDAASLLFPHLSRVCEQLLDKPHVFPTPGTRHQARLVLDCALLLWRRLQGNSGNEYVRFAGADASPQAGHDFLLSSSDYIRKDKLVPLVQAVRRMIQDAEDRLLGTWTGQSEQSIADHQFVRCSLRKEDDIPVALGNSASSAAHKVAGMLHKYALRCSSEVALQNYLSSVFSFCSDMGTELHISSFRVQTLDQLLPSWLRLGDLTEDVQCCAPDSLLLESDVCLPSDSNQLVSLPNPAEDPHETDQVNSQPFLPKALLIPGMLHVMSNGLQHVTSQLTYFDHWFDQLQVIEQLWKNGRLLRFINYCLKPAAPEHITAMFFQKKLGSLYVKRWNEVSRFCLRLADLLPYLKAFWNADAFNSAKKTTSSADSEFDPCKLTAILQDAMFFACHVESLVPGIGNQNMTV